MVVRSPQHRRLSVLRLEVQRRIRTGPVVVCAAQDENRALDPPEKARTAANEPTVTSGSTASCSISTTL
jgi:hypothetical protein